MQLLSPFPLSTYSVNDITKDGVILEYLSCTAPPPRLAGQPGKIPLHTSEWTVVRSSNIPGDVPHHDAASLVRLIRQDIASLTTPNASPELQVLSGCWSSQSSPNFVLIFAGKPESKIVMKYRHSLTRYFGAGCRLAPQTGYTRVMLNHVRVALNEDGCLPDHEVLKAELAANPLWSGVQ